MTTLEIQQLRGSPDDPFGLMWLGAKGEGIQVNVEFKEEDLSTMQARIRRLRKRHPDRIYRLVETKVLDG